MSRVKSVLKNKFDMDSYNQTIKEDIERKEKEELDKQRKKEGIRYREVFSNNNEITKAIEDLDIKDLKILLQYTYDFEENENLDVNFRNLIKEIREKYFVEFDTKLVRDYVNHAETVYLNKSKYLNKGIQIKFLRLFVNAILFNNLSIFNKYGISFNFLEHEVKDEASYIFKKFIKDFPKMFFGLVSDRLIEKMKRFINIKDPILKEVIYLQLIGDEEFKGLDPVLNKNTKDTILEYIDYVDCRKIFQKFDMTYFELSRSQKDEIFKIIKEMTYTIIGSLRTGGGYLFYKFLESFVNDAIGEKLDTMLEPSDLYSDDEFYKEANKDSYDTSQDYFALLIQDFVEFRTLLRDEPEEAISLLEDIAGDLEHYAFKVNGRRLDFASDIIERVKRYTDLGELSEADQYQLLGDIYEGINNGENIFETISKTLSYNDLEETYEV